MSDPTTPELRTYRDPVSGVTVRQLTDHRAHSYHLYFTNSGWWDSNRRLLFGSDRGNATNLYSLDLETFQITRLTDIGPGEEHDFQGATINPARAEAYWWHQGVLHGIDLRTHRRRVLHTCPDGWTAHGSSASADGRYVVASAAEKVDVGPVDLGAGYVGFGALFEARALHRIIRIPTDDEHHPAEVLHEERAWIGHVNPSPTQPNLITFCYEGPWTRVGQRIWGMDLNECRPWKIRPQEPGEGIGHEYWMEDGVTVGYHGSSNGRSVFGFRRYDNQHAVEVPFPHDSNHFHSNRPDLIVADGPARGLTPHVLLSRFDGKNVDGPRVLCVHRGSRHIQHLHVHPRFSPDGTQVLYTSDPRGYGQLFLVDVPAFEQLPTLAEVEAARKR
jgi:oligogalacturonide lyase